MSYLDLPRLHIAGRFFCDPSSVNNDPHHYLPENTNPAPWQMPKGMHFFRIFDTKVMRAVTLDGTSDGSIVAAAFRTTDKPVEAKMVDLDVYQQGTTQLFGVNISLANDAGSLTAEMRTPVLNGVWFDAVLPTRGWNLQYGDGSYGGDSNACGVFQTLLWVAEEDWKFQGGVMAELKETCTPKHRNGKIVYPLSFRFVLDGYWNVVGTSDYQTGRIVGTIGPWRDGEPMETPGARWLEPRPLDKKTAAWNVPAFYRAPFRLKQPNLLQIDWGGSVCRVAVGGDPVPLGEVTVKVGAPNQRLDLGTIRIDAPTYQKQAGISELTIDPEKAKLLESNPLELWTSRADIGEQRIFAEGSDGMFCAAENRALRMTSNPAYASSEGHSRVLVTKWGKPAKGVTPKIAVIPVEGGTPGATVPPGNPGDTEQAKGALVAEAEPADQAGFASVTFKAAKDPGSRTKQLDGQLYFVYAYLGAEPPVEEVLQEAQISVVLFSDYRPSDKPGWDEIREIMVPYAKLYPGMREKFDLADKEAFLFYSNNPGAGYFTKAGFDIHAPTGKAYPEIQTGALPYYISLPLTDPRYMPVTRDLSPPKVEAVLNFILNEQQAFRAAHPDDDGGAAPADKGATS